MAICEVETSRTARRNRALRQIERLTALQKETLDYLRELDEKEARINIQREAARFNLERTEKSLIELHQELEQVK